MRLPEILYIIGISGLLVLIVGLLLFPNNNKQIDECKKDCKNLSMTFFKFEEPTFGSSADCWCKKQGETKQIW